MKWFKSRWYEQEEHQPPATCYAFPFFVAIHILPNVSLCKLFSVCVCVCCTANRYFLILLFFIQFHLKSFTRPKLPPFCIVSCKSIHWVLLARAWYTVSVVWRQIIKFKRKTFNLWRGLCIHYLTSKFLSFVIFHSYSVDFVCNLYNCAYFFFILSVSVR